MLVFRVLSDLVLLVHLAWVVFVIASFLLILIGRLVRWSWVRNVRFRVIAGSSVFLQRRCLADVAFACIELQELRFDGIIGKVWQTKLQQLQCR